MKKNIAKTFTFLIASAMLLGSSFSAFAYEPTSFSIGKVVSPAEEKLVKIGGLNYEITKAPSNVPGKCTVSVNTLSTVPNIVIPAQINYQGKLYNVTAIGENAFAENKYIKSIQLGKYVESVAPTAFVGAFSLADISVEVGSNSFVAMDGILYTKDKTTVVACPMAKEIATYTAPNTVTKIAACAFYGNSSLYNVILNNMKISEIGDFAFANCDHLAVCNMGYTINKIGMAAFAETDLKSLVLPVYLKEIGSGAFAETKIETVRIPDEVTVIPYGAFSNCGKLSSVKWGDKLETIEDYAFAGTALKSIKITDYVKSVGYSAFADCESLQTVTLGKRINTIGEYAFANCPLIMSVSIPASVNKIGDDAFLGCKKLANIYVETTNPTYASDNGVLYSKGKVELLLYPAAKMETQFTIPTETVNIRPDALTDARYINEFGVGSGNSKFRADDGVLYTIDGYELIRFPMGKNYNGYSIPDTVYKIAPSAFYGSVVTGIFNISGNVSEIGENAFAGCTNVTAFNVSAKNTKYTSVDGVLYTKDMTHLLNYPVNKKEASVIVPEGVAVIKDNAFAKTSAAEVLLPETLVEIGVDAFADSKVAKVNLPSSLSTIEDRAFNNTFITELTIPGSINEVGKGAFANNAFLSTAEFTGTPYIGTIGSNIFANDPSLTKIYVPSAYIKEYTSILVNMDVENYSELMTYRN